MLTAAALWACHQSPRKVLQSQPCYRAAHRAEATSLRAESYSWRIASVALIWTCENRRTQSEDMGLTLQPNEHQQLAIVHAAPACIALHTPEAGTTAGSTAASGLDSSR